VDHGSTGGVLCGDVLRPIAWDFLADISPVAGSAVLAANFPSLGIGFLGVSVAFGVDRAHHGLCGRPRLGRALQLRRDRRLWAGGRFKATDVVPYIIAQVAGAIAAAAVLYVIASGKPEWVAGGFASNGYGELSPGKYSLASCFLSEVIATFFFIYVIIGTTSKGRRGRICRDTHRALPDADPSVS